MALPVVRFRINATPGIVRLKNAEQKVKDAVLKAQREHGARAKDFIQRTRFGAPVHFGPSPSPANKLANRTGRLKDSVAFRVRQQVNSVTLEVSAGRSGSSVLPYVWPQERDTTIYPKRARKLTVPLRDNMDARGLAIETATEALSQPGTFIKEFPKGGQPFIARRTEEGDLKFLFVLKDRVRLAKPRLRLRDSMLKLEKIRIRELQRLVGAALA